MPASAGAGLNCGFNLNGAGCSISRAICDKACLSTGLSPDTRKLAAAKAPRLEKMSGKAHDAYSRSLPPFENREGPALSGVEGMVQPQLR
jgi:hypothetical protein